MAAFATVSDSIAFYESRIDNLAALLAALHANAACFDEEDCGWVEAEIARLEAEQSKTEERIAKLITSSAELEEKQQLLDQRMQVLKDMDASTQCLKQNKELRRKFVRKQDKLQRAVDALHAELAKYRDIDQ